MIIINYKISVSKQEDLIALHAIYDIIHYIFIYEWIDTSYTFVFTIKVHQQFGQFLFSNVLRVTYKLG